MGISLFLYLGLGKYIERVKFCVVGWIGNPNQIRNFNTEVPMVKCIQSTWVPEIYEVWFTMLKILLTTFKVCPHFGSTTPQNI